MSRFSCRLSFGFGFALAIAPGLAPVAPVWGQSVAAPSLVWESAPGSSALVAVRLTGLTPATLAPLRTASETDSRWGLVLAVRLAGVEGVVPADRPAILGTYQVIATDPLALRFTPRYPFDATRRYQATFDPDGPAGPAAPRTVDRLPTTFPPRVATVVERIEPTGDRLPANILRFYIHFSAAMGRGDAYAHLRLEDAAGHPLDHPFLELGEELWDPTGMRLTVLLDPGRVKRGLRPHEELGPILEPGRSYTLRIDPSWRDAIGQPLTAPASKTFSTEPTDETSPTPTTWRITPPRAGVVTPLVVEFADTLDRATIASGLTLLGPNDHPVPGTAEAHADGSGWQITPATPWAAGTYTLAINPDLEDLCGNSIRRPFEVDIQRDVPTTPDPTRIRLLVEIRD